MSEEQSGSVEQSQVTESVAQPQAQPEASPIPEKFGGDVHKLADAYKNLESRMGSMYSLPSEDSSSERWDEFSQRVESTGKFLKMPDPTNPESMETFYSSIGRPESPDNYKIDIPEEIQPFVDNNRVNVYKDVAYKVGLSGDQMKALADAEMQLSLQDYQNTLDEYASSEKQLRAHWGPDYNNRLSGAKAALNSYSNAYPDAVNRLMNGPECNNPALIAMLSELGQSLQESGALQGQNSVQYGMSSDEARDKIMEIRGNKNHAFHDERNAAHKEAVDRMRKLYQIAYPDG